MYSEEEIERRKAAAQEAKKALSMNMKQKKAKGTNVAKTVL